MTKIDDRELDERYELSMGRIREIPEEEAAPERFRDYFRSMARWLLEMDHVRSLLRSGAYRELPVAERSALNRKMYEPILPEQYAESYMNPSAAAERLGKEEGACLCFLAAELAGMPAWLFDGFSEAVDAHLELFIEIYNAVCSGAETKELKDILYWFVSDYCDVLAAERIRQGIEPAENPAVRILREADLEDVSYLYDYGEYVTENEIETARHLASLDEETVRRMADTFTEGFRLGFVHAGKDLSKKRTVNIRYRLGFERMIRLAVSNFRQMGLEPVIFRAARSVINRRGVHRIGYAGADPNPQFAWDHREDLALVLDGRLAERKLSVMRSTYEQHKEIAAQHAGPALCEVFGETPFEPAPCRETLTFSGRQQKLSAQMAVEAASITNRYIIGSERSFTIIAFPVPSIGEQYGEILRETIRINTLDAERYGNIQQTMIEALDQGDRVIVKGRGQNRTDLTVRLQKLDDPSRQTRFENCLADVNIPLGEVFTSPELEGTHGVLHVCGVYLDGLYYRDLELTFEDGCVTKYGCAVFETEEENRAYIRENILFHHPTLPMGEFAIGTNTAAYRMAKQYGIAGLLPILIAEKTGPHFAVGDTCYSHEEDVPVHNPDGREMIARENRFSLLRGEHPSKAYFGCHTDITLPYEELGLLAVADENGILREILRDGRFVLPGTESLNEDLDMINDSL